MIADNIERLMLEQFRRLNDKVDNLTENVRELNREMHAFRHHGRANELDIEANRNQNARLQQRLERVERRLELSEPDPASPTGFSEDLAPYSTRTNKK